MRRTSPTGLLFMSSTERSYVGCVSSLNCSSSGAKDGDHEPGTRRRHQSASMQP